MLAEKTEKTINVTQGEFKLSDDPDVVLSTLLGSCVAICLCDPVRRIGGMNHFLLPDNGGGATGDHVKYGVNAMELLINGLIKKGAARDRLVAKAFGGARMDGNLRDIGESNIRFARDFLQRENIPCEGESLGGLQARRVLFWPTTFRARQRLVPRETVREAPPPSRAADVTLF